MKKISKQLEEKDIDLFYLYKKFKQNKQEKIFKEEFEDLILSICSDFSMEDINKLFLYYKSGSRISLETEQFYERFCKELQIPALKS